MRYALRIERDDNGTLLVTAPDLPEVATFGNDGADALHSALDAIETAIQWRMSNREDIPLPSAVGEPAIDLPALSIMKIELYRVLRASGMTKADLARALGWKPTQVDRLFDLRHASRVDQVEAAFHALGKRLEIEVRSAA